MMPHVRTDTEARNDLAAIFAEQFGGIPRVFRAPGRVNLIGEHTNYNDGFAWYVEAFREFVSAGYEQAAGETPEIYVSSAGEGASEIS